MMPQPRSQGAGQTRCSFGPHGGGGVQYGAGVGVGVTQTTPQPPMHPSALGHAKTSVTAHGGGVHTATTCVGVGVAVGVKVGGVSPGRSRTVSVPEELVANSRAPVGSLATTL